MAESLRALRLFKSVYESGSFTAAGIREHVTQSGVSQQIRKLEQFLGVDLFTRDRGKISATCEGELYYRWCVDILNMCCEARTAVKEFAKNQPQSISVGIVPLMCAGTIGRALRLLVELKPGLEIRVVEGFTEDLTEQIRQRKLDIAIACATPVQSGVNSRFFARIAEALVTRREPGKIQSGRIADLGPLKLAAFGPPAHRQFVQSHLANHGIEIQRVLEFESLAGAFDLIANSDWVAIMPEHSPNQVSLSVTAITDLPLSHEFFVLEPDPPHKSAAMQAFRRILNVA